MPQFETRNAADNPQDENVELIGSTNLKDEIQKVGVIRGSWSLNGQEFRNFEARSPGEVCRRINANTPQHGVTASIDDGYHLVLASNGSDKLAIGSGRAADIDRHRQAILDRNLAQGGGHLQSDSAALEAASKDMDVIPDVLEALGLEATPDLVAERGGPDWQTGMSAEDREKARKAPAGDYVADTQERLDQGNKGPSAGTVGLNKGPSDTTSKDPHNPPGAPAPLAGPGHEDDGMGHAPPENAKPGSSPRTKERPSK